MKQLRLSPLVAFAAILCLLLCLILIGDVAAAQSTTQNIRDGVSSVSDGNTVNTPLERIIQIVVNIILFLVGAVAVIMIIIGGIRYTTANGDSSRLTAAKNTVLYAVAGLVIAIAAFAIVNFIIEAIV